MIPHRLIGLKITHRFSDDWYAIVNSVDEDTNVAKVKCTNFKDPDNEFSWFEDWNLVHVMSGLDNGEYSWERV